MVVPRIGTIECLLCRLRKGGGLVAVDVWWHGCPGNPVQNCTPTLTDSCFQYGLWCRSSEFRVQVSSVFEFD